MSEKQKKPIKIRVERAQPTDVVDILRMLQASEKEFPHPGMDSLSRDELLFHLYQFVTNQDCLGVLAKIGRRPVGFLLSQKQWRPIGVPRKYLLIWRFHIDPQHRKNNILKLMLAEVFARARADGIDTWESNSSDEIVDFCKGYFKGEAKVVYHRIACKF